VSSNKEEVKKNETQLIEPEKDGDMKKDFLANMSGPYNWKFPECDVSYQKMRSSKSDIKF
jgi:hypothetical protein